MIRASLIKLVPVLLLAFGVATALGSVGCSECFELPGGGQDCDGDGQADFGS